MRFKGLFLCTTCFFFHEEWRITQLWSSSIILYSGSRIILIITLKHLNKYIFIGVSSPAEADLFILVLVGSLCWTVQVYQGLVAYIVGGCVHWHFVQPEGGDGTSPRSRALLHLYCALTVSFGSICKHALLGEGAHWLLDRYDSHVDSNSDDADTNNSLSSQDAEKGQTGRTQVHTQLAPISNSNGPIADLACTRKLVLQARLANRLALPFSATYGTTLAASAEQVYRLHRGSVAIERHDDTHRTLSALAKFGAALIAIVFGYVYHDSRFTIYDL